MKKLISIDIGSTYTKGALFIHKENSLEMAEYKNCPTTVNNLMEGFATVLQSLGGMSEDTEIFFSSSAKGGLKVAAIGLVPDLTLNVAKLTALSAGAKITDVYSYKLSRKDIEQLEQSCPDIILFTGGTDGGAESYNLHNAKMLAGLGLDCAIIYAGNKFLQPDISKILSGKQLYLTENILPELEHPIPEPANRKIRDIFLNKITSGKGLDKISALVNTKPAPTPYSMFEFVKTINKVSPDFGDFCLIDLGGATTDFYSCVSEDCIPPEVILKGIKEPPVTRTVEGDLGMRINAGAVYEHMEEFIDNELYENGLDKKSFAEFLAGFESGENVKAEGEKEFIFDRILAASCCMGSAERHCGYREEMYTAGGKFWIQKGKDLCGIKKIIGSGGFISKNRDFNPEKYMRRRIDKYGRLLLLPESPEYFVDYNYIFPLLANLSFNYPKEAVSLGLNSISRN